MSAIDQAGTRKEVVRNFATETTMHGLKFLFARGIIRNIVWMVLILGSCSLVYIQVYAQINKYLAKEISTQTDISYPDSLPFPSVMICNSNMFRISKVYQYDGLYEMITDIYSRKTSESQRYVPPDIQTHNKTMATLTAMFDGNATKLMQALGHDINDMFLNCTNPKGAKCNASSFKLQMTENGLCFIFNFSADVSQAGPANAFTLYINLQAYEAMSGPSQLSSLKVSTYNNRDYPLSVNSINVAPGYMSVIGLKYHSEARLTSCVDKSELRHFPTDQYSSATCKIDNTLAGIEKNCNCSPHYAPKTKMNVTTCNITSYFNCVMFFNIDSLRNASLPCNESCETEGYTTSLSLAKISNNVMKSLENATGAKMTTDFTQAMEATTRKNAIDVNKMLDIKNQLAESVKIATDFGLWPTNAGVESLSAKMKRFSNSYNSYANSFSDMIVQSQDYLRPSFDIYGLGGCTTTAPPPGGSPVSVVNDTKVPFGYRSLMSSEQSNLYQENIEENQELATEIFIAWSNTWEKLLRCPCPYHYAIRPVMYRNFADMMNDINSYFELRMTKYEWSLNQTKYSDFTQTYNTMCLEYLQTATNFVDALIALKTDNLTQTIFAHLNDTDFNNNLFWLTVNYASTSVFQSPLQYIECNNNSNSQANSFANCFNDIISESCNNCSAASGPGSSSGSGPGSGPGRRKRQAPLGSQSTSSTLVCCNMKIMPTNEYYWNFFNTLQKNLDTLISETRMFIGDVKLRCVQTESGFNNLDTELTTYSDQWSWKDEFYSANFLGIQIYFSELSKQTITQSQPYDFFSLICDIGGSLGLFLGASILTFFEIVDMCIFGICTRKKAK